MCGRFALIDLSQFTAMFPWIAPAAPPPPRYNIAPTQPVLAAICQGNECRLEPLTWGLIPHWAKDRSSSARMINARCETAAQKPAFREAMRLRRAIIPASGFYEWKREGRLKQPYFIERRDRTPMLFAGLWDTWTNPQGSAVKSCTILTTPSGREIRELHDRMPLVLEQAEAKQWLRGSAEEAASLLKPADAGQWKLRAVSPTVNNAAAHGPHLLDPAASAGLFGDG